MITEVIVQGEPAARTARRSFVSAKSRAHILLYSFLAFAMASGLFLRLYNLDKFGYWTDELFHVLAAKSYLENQTLSIPLLGEYTRALPVTYITAASFKLLGETEGAARLPFVLINVAFIGTGFLILRKLFSKNMALIFAVVMSLSPFAIIMARECRMYSPFQGLYFLMSMAFLAGFESPPQTFAEGKGSWRASLERKFEIDTRWLALSIPLFLASVSVHPLTYNFVFVLFAYALTMSAHQLLTSRRSAVVWKYAALAALIVLGFLYLGLFKKPFLRHMINVAVDIPFWAIYKAEDYGFYRYFLSDNYPAFFFLLPLGTFLCVKLHGKRGAFLALSFFVLFFMHSFAFGRKEARYIFYIFPFFIITSAPAMAWVLKALREGLKDAALFRSSKLRNFSLLHALPALNLLAYPWLGNSKKSALENSHTDWKSLPDSLKQEALRSTVLTPNYLSYLYYFESSPAYHVPINDDIGDPASEPGLVGNDAHMIETVEAVPDLMIIADESKFKKDVYFSKRAREHIRTHLEAVPHSGDPRILVFRKNGKDLTLPLTTP